MWKSDEVYMTSEIIQVMFILTYDRKEEFYFSFKRIGTADTYMLLCGYFILS